MRDLAKLSVTRSLLLAAVALIHILLGATNSLADNNTVTKLHFLTKSERESVRSLAKQVINDDAPIARVGLNVVDFKPDSDETNSLKAHLRLGVSRSPKNPVAGVQVVVSW